MPPKSFLFIILLLMFTDIESTAQIKLPKIKKVNDVTDIFKKKQKDEKKEDEKKEENNKDTDPAPTEKKRKDNSLFKKKTENYINVSAEDIAGKWNGRMELNPGLDIEFEMRITPSGNNLSVIADYKTAYGRMKYLMTGTILNGQIDLYENEVLEQGPGTNLHILYKKKYTAGFISINNKIKMIGKYEPDGQFIYQNKKPVATEQRIYGNDFSLFKIDEAKIEREFDQYIFHAGNDQDEYLRRMMIYFADNKYYNYSRKCRSSSFRYYILSKDKEGLFTKVLGRYFEETSKGELVDHKDSVEIVVQFDKGMPYRIGYPKAESLPEVTPMHKGEIGQLQFPDEAKERVIKLFLAENKVRDSVFEENRKRSQAAIEKKLLQQYGNFNCQECFVKRTDGEQYEYEVTDWDEKGNPFTKTKTGTKNIITYTNRCNQVITVVGVQRVGTTNKGPYYVDISFSLKPKQVMSFEQDGIGAMLGVFINLTSLDPEINPEYSRQYMRISGKSKPLIQ